MADISAGALQAYISKRKQERYLKRKPIKLEDGSIQEPVKKGIASKTIINEIVIIKEMFKHAHRWGYVKINPAEHLQRPKLVKKEIEILQPGEFNKLLENSGNLYRIAFLTAILTGVRGGELWACQWGDMDWNSKRLYVRRSVWNNSFQIPNRRTLSGKLIFRITLFSK